MKQQLKLSRESSRVEKLGKDGDVFFCNSPHITACQRYHTL